MTGNTTVDFFLALALLLGAARLLGLHSDYCTGGRESEQR